jgi:hypothetical protein
MAKKVMVSLCLLSLLIPVMAMADVSIVQEWCEQLNEGSYDYILIHFSVINFSLATPICDLHLIPEPSPAVPGCEITECSVPDGWTCSLAPGGGADWMSLTPSACIEAGHILSGFDLVLQIQDGQYCCYIVQFTDGQGSVIAEQEECFYCSLVPAEKTTWGNIKGLYSN